MSNSRLPSPSHLLHSMPFTTDHKISLNSTLTTQGDVSTNYKVQVASIPEKKPNTHHFNTKCIRNYSEYILTRCRSVILILSEGQATPVTQQF